MNALETFLADLYDGRLPRDLVRAVEAWVEENRDNYVDEDALLGALQLEIRAELTGRNGE